MSLKNNEKISIRFFNDKEVRAVWHNDKWWFSVADIIAIIADSDNPRKYWTVLKTRLKAKNNELTTKCSQLKLRANDGKRYLTDCLIQDDIIKLVEAIPSKKAAQFIKWLTYSPDTIDGKSKDKAYALFESSMIDSIEIGTTKGLQQIHAYLFGGLYDFAGQIRNKTISKGGFTFAPDQFLAASLEQIEKMPQNTFNEIMNKYVEMNVAHPFMEGNGRATRIWLDLIFKKRLKRCVDWSKINKNDYLNAMEKSASDASVIKGLVKNALTDEINSREMFMKGIDYSYYYEENE